VPTIGPRDKPPTVAGAAGEQCLPC
jgi:hypothetical protein